MGGRREAFRAWSHWCGGRRRTGLRCPWVAAGPGQVHAHQVPPDGRPPRGLQGLAGLRDDAPSEARGADGERAGRPRGGRRSGGRARRRPEHQRSTPSTARLEAAAGPAGPGRASRRRAERSSRRGRRAGGQAPRRSEIRRPGPKAPGTPAEHTKYRPIGGRRGACRAWPGFETTRRAKLAARTASGRAGPAAVGDQAAGPEGARNTSGAH